MCAFPTLARPLGLAALLLATAAAATPWQWRDASGRMVYSDRPPPSDVRSSQIVREPESAMPRDRGGAAAAESADRAAPGEGVAGAASASAPDGRTQGAPEAGAGAASSASPTWVEREAAFRKRKLDREAAAAKAREDRESAESSRRACNDLRTAVRTLQSGLRVVTVDANGNPATIDEAERARRLASARHDLARNCASS